MNFEKDFKTLNSLNRDKYVEVYSELGKKMFSECIIPTVGDFATNNRDKLEQITNFTGNIDDIDQSLKRREANYTEEDSNKFMTSVIASNITNITESGYFYKKLIASCDDMKIVATDCKDKGVKVNLPIDENEYNYKIKFRTIDELNTYTESYEEFCKLTKDMSKIHVRTLLSCKADPKHRCFCKKCAGAFKRSKEDYFTPENMGVYSTLMITEHATQASLDSMNKGVTASLNALIETRLDAKEFTDYDKVKDKINELIDQIGNIGVMSRYYEIALLSRFYMNSDGVSYSPSSLQTSINKRKDKLAIFINSPTKKNFKNLISSKRIEATSIKSKIMMDDYR